ncbi:MAG TPA: hypothetical protein VGG16_03210 [Streptosporangiaceae bacterium]
MHELARERTRDNLELAQDLRVVCQLRNLQRVIRSERKAERRLIEAWQARQAAEAALETR